MRGDGPDASGRDIEGEVDRALPARREARGARREGHGGMARAVMEELEQVALGEILQEMARLAAARQVGDDGAVARARMGLLDAVELWAGANAALREAMREREADGQSQGAAR